jgi:hypothetical protein
MQTESLRVGPTSTFLQRGLVKIKSSHFVMAGSTGARENGIVAGGVRRRGFFIVARSLKANGAIDSHPPIAEVRPSFNIIHSPIPPAATEHPARQFEKGASYDATHVSQAMSVRPARVHIH